MRRTRFLALVVLLVVLAAGCGQKPGVGDETQAVSGGSGFDTGTSTDGGVDAGGSAGADGGFSSGDGGDVVDGAAGAGAPDASGGAGGAVSGDGGTSGGATGAGATGGGGTASGPRDGGTTAGGGTTSGGGGGGGAAAAGDRTGISANTIKVGVHAPLTGAAPVPQDVFRDALPIYWEFVKRTQGGVFGKDVEVVFRDDQFDPSAAVQACRQMVEQEKVFLLIGAAGGDQITACAKYANSVGVPYLSPGVNEEGLSGLRGYFAISQTYRQQAPLLGQIAARASQAKKVAIIHEDTPTFRGARGAAVDAMRQNGLQIVYNELISKGASQAEILTTSNQLRGSGADVVYFLGPPATLISLSQQGQGQGYVPAYIGPGLSNGLNLVTAAGCPGLGKAQYLSPFPQLDVIDRFDPNFRKEFARQLGRQPGSRDDLAVAIWGLSKMTHQFFLAAGEGVSRQSLVAAAESGRVFETNVFPTARYDARNHFGSTSAHVLRADCGSRTWKTTATFASRR